MRSMNKEPIGLYIFRFVTGFGLFAFMCMLYWSSTLVEDRLTSIRTEQAQLKEDLYNLRSDLLKAFLEEQQHLQKIYGCGAYCATQASEMSAPQKREEVHQDPAASRWKQSQSESLC